MCWSISSHRFLLKQADFTEALKFASAGLWQQQSQVSRFENLGVPGVLCGAPDGQLGHQISSVALPLLGMMVAPFMCHVPSNFFWATIQVEVGPRSKCPALKCGKCLSVKLYCVPLHLTKNLSTSKHAPAAAVQMTLSCVHGECAWARKKEERRTLQGE